MNFKKIKEAVSISQVLEHYGILESLIMRGASYRGDCPFCESDDNNPFSVSLEKNCFNAFCCGKHGNILDFVAANENISIKQAAEFLNNLFKVEKKPAQKKENRSEKQKQEESKDAPGRNMPLAFTLDGIDPAHPNVKKLGIPEETARTFGAGYFSGRGMFKDYVVVPVYSFEGVLLAYTAVSPKHPVIPVYPAKFDPTIELFGKYRLCDRDRTAERQIIVTRHPLDVLALAGHGYETVAFMGEGITETQAKLLNRCCGSSRKLIFFMEYDDPATVPALSMLMQFFYIRTVRFERNPDTPYTFDNETLEMLEI